MADQTGPGAAGNGAGPGDGSTPPGAGGPPDDRSAPRPASAGERAGITAGRHDRQAGSGRAPGTEGRRAADGASDGAGRAPVSADQAAQRMASIGAGVALTELLAGFIVELRSAGLPVSLTENLDAMAAIQHIPLDDRDAFKYALGATLVKNAAHWRVF